MASMDSTARGPAPDPSGADERVGLDGRDDLARPVAPEPGPPAPANPAARARVPARPEPILARPGVVVAVVALVLVVYYVVPISADRAAPYRALAALVSLAGLGVVTVRQLRCRDDPVGRLVTILAIVIATFAGAFYGLSLSAGQFEGIENRTDALYFTVVTMATIGYGDIHPVGQAARLVVLVSIAFNAVFVAAIASALVSVLRSGRDPGDPGDTGNQGD